jgi:pimeloyl-ACP methyl ester carboxylesterase
MEDVVNTSSDILPFFSTYHGAHDYVQAVQAIKPESVAIYALSYGTYFTNVYLQLPGARADVVVMDGPVPANRWALENNAQWVSRVSMDILRLCGQISSTCAAKTGVMGQIPRLVMDSIVDGTLPCLAKLPWLNQRVAASYSSFMTLNQTAHVLLGPFWYRLYRCSESDIAQLTTFHSGMQQRHRRDTGAVPEFREYANGLAINIAASEVYSYGSEALALNYSQQVLLTSRVFADATPELIASFAREFWPRYVPNPETYMKFARPHVPVHVQVGTLDPNTPHGNGPWLVRALGPAANLTTVPYAAHGTLSPGADCANSIIIDFLLSLGTIRNTSCLGSIRAPDFEGALPETQRLSDTFFGSTRLWNSNASAENVQPHCVIPAVSRGSDKSDENGHRFTSGQLAGLILGTMGLAALLTVVVMSLFRSQRRYWTPGKTVPSELGGLEARLL